MPINPLWIYAFMAVMVTAIWFVGSYEEAKRTRQLYEAAAAFGFAPRAAGTWNPRREALHALFKRGTSGRAYNVVEGTADGLAARLFDYAYSVPGGKSSQTHIQTVALFELAQSALPTFELYPERFYHKIAELVGFKDIDFDGFAEFSDNYRLLGPDEAAIRGLFDPGVVSRLDADLGWTVEGAGRALLVYRPDKSVAPADLADFLRRARQVAGAFGRR